MGAFSLSLSYRYPAAGPCSFPLLATKRGFMKPAQIHDAIHKASHETSRIATAQLKAEASNSGWPSHLVNSMHVVYDNNEFAVHTHEKHHAESLDHEYGLPGRQPNPAIRRTNNRTAEAENFFVGRLFNHLEGLL